jgi:ribosomal protein L6P/L9E
MILSKVYNNHFTNIKLMNLAGLPTILFFSSSKKILLKIKVNNNIIIKRNSLMVLNNNIKYQDYNNFIKFVNHYLNCSNLTYYSNFIKLHLVGLGFKNFVLKNELFILVGDCNYLVFLIPQGLKIYCKKNQIYILGNNLVDI